MGITNNYLVIKDVLYQLELQSNNIGKVSSSFGGGYGIVHGILLFIPFCIIYGIIIVFPMTFIPGLNAKLDPSIVEAIEVASRLVFGYCYYHKFIHAGIYRKG